MSADGDAVADQVLPELALNDRNHVGGEGDIDDAPTAGANKVIVNVRPYVEDDVATIAGPDADFTTLEQSRRDAMHGCQRHPCIISASEPWRSRFVACPTARRFVRIASL